MRNFFYQIKNKNIIIFSDLTFLFLNYGKKKVINTIIEIIKKLIKNNNTIILPTYNLDFPLIKKTSADKKFIHTGFLNKYLLNLFNFQRTSRPMYNYAILGPNIDKFLKLKQSTSFGTDSVIGYLSKNNGIGIGIGIDKDKFNWVTLHVCEELSKVPYRFFKTFKGINIDTKKFVEEKMYVRKKKLNYENDGSKILNELNKTKKILNFEKNGMNISFLNLSNYYRLGMKLLSKNKYSLVK